MNPEETVKPQVNVEDTDTQLDDVQLEEVAGGTAVYEPSGHPSRNDVYEPTGHPSRNDVYEPSGHPSRTD